MSPLALAVVLAVAASPPTFPPAEVTRGLRGTCHTVFAGTAVEPFDFEVQGTMRDYLGPGRHVVVVRLLGERTGFTGVVAGMSGSPCLVDGRLLGALAYAFAPFAKEPIAGIVPIDDMREVLELPAAARPARLAPSLPASPPPSGPTPALGGPASASAPALDGPAPVPALAGGALEPIVTPLSYAGVSPAIAARFTPDLAAAGFVPVAGGGHSDLTPGSAGLVPGGAVAAVLVRGDVDMAATGTVTTVDGDAVLAFGHPFLGIGALSLPMAQATIVHTLASAQRSFKMATTGALVGELTEDRLTAIGGRLGPTPRMVRVWGRIATPRGTRAFAFEVARALELTPRLLAMALAGALAGRADVGARGTVHLDATLRLGCLPPQRLTGTFATERDEGLLAEPALAVARHFGALWQAPFGPPPDASVCVEVALSAEPFEEQVVGLALDRGHARPGDEVTLAVRLRRRDVADTTAHATLVVPRAWAGQTITVSAGGASLAEEVARRGVTPPRPQSLAELAAVLAARRPDGALYWLATRPGAGLQAGAHQLDFLPPSAVVLAAGAAGRRPLDEGLAWEQRMARPGTVAGRASAALHVAAR